MSRHRRRSILLCNRADPRPAPFCRSTALVFLMIPGVGLLYSGLLRRKNALSMLLISFLAIAVGSFQWFL